MRQLVNQVPTDKLLMKWTPLPIELGDRSVNITLPQKWSASHKEDCEMSPFRARITLPKPLWYSTGLILLFNGLLFAWLLININNQALLASVDYWAQTLGPLLMLPFGFLALGRLWRRYTSGRSTLPLDRPGKLLVPILLGLS